MSLQQSTAYKPNLNAQGQPQRWKYHLAMCLTTMGQSISLHSPLWDISKTQCSLKGDFCLKVKYYHSQPQISQEDGSFEMEDAHKGFMNPQKILSIHTLEHKQVIKLSENLYHLLHLVIFLVEQCDSPDRSVWLVIQYHLPRECLFSSWGSLQF